MIFLVFKLLSQSRFFFYNRIYISEATRLIIVNIDGVIEKIIKKKKHFNIYCFAIIPNSNIFFLIQNICMIYIMYLNILNFTLLIHHKSNKYFKVNFMIGRHQRQNKIFVFSLNSIYTQLICKKSISDNYLFTYKISTVY